LNGAGKTTLIRMMPGMIKALAMATISLGLFQPFIVALRASIDQNYE
jgi:ABC-type multidrug transport system ATPase subunit